jgi:hypothetical protein
MPSWPLTMLQPESPIHHRPLGMPDGSHECEARQLTGFEALGLVESVAGPHMGRR